MAAKQLLFDEAARQAILRGVSKLSKAVWQPLSLMVLAGLTPSEWEIPIVDEKLGVPDYDSRLRPDLVSNLSYRNNSRPDRRTYADFQRQWCPFPGMNRMQLQTQA